MSITERIEEQEILLALQHERVIEPSHFDVALKEQVTFVPFDSEGGYIEVVNG